MADEYYNIELEEGVYFVQWGSKPGWCSTYIIEITRIEENKMWYKILDNLKNSKSPWPAGEIPTTTDAFKYRALRIEKIIDEKHLKRLKMEYKLENGGK